MDSCTRGVEKEPLNILLTNQIYCTLKLYDQLLCQTSKFSSKSLTIANIRTSIRNHLTCSW